MKIADLTPDPRNANRGTERGRYALETSLRKYGAGRSILLDKHGRVIAGNKTVNVAGEIGLNDVVVIPTDGTKLVAVQRTDLDLECDKEARELAYADNRVGELDLDFDPQQMRIDIEEGLDLSAFWTEHELQLIAGDLTETGSSSSETKEINPDEILLAHKCPRCGFQFDDPKP